MTLTAGELRTRALERVSVRLPLRCQSDLDAAIRALGSPRVLNADRAAIAREVLDYLADHRAAVRSVIEQAQEGAR